MSAAESTKRQAYSILVSVLVPLFVFLTMVGLQSLRHAWQLPHLPPPVDPALPPGCPDARIEKAAASCNEAVETCDPANYRTQPLYCCSPQSSRSSDWTIDIELKVQGAQSDCEYDLLAVDSSIVGLHPDQPNYRDLSLLRAGPFAKEYRLAGSPWRTYALAPRWHRAGQVGFAGDSRLFVFYQKDGLNIRIYPLLLFTLELIGASYLLLLFARFRPGGPSELRFLRRARWRSVAAVSGFGGLVSGLLLLLRPPDVGGYDVASPGIRLLAVPLLLFALLAGIGCVMDGARRMLAEERLPARLLLLTPIVLFIGICTLFSYRHLSAYGSLGGIDMIHFKSIYYAYYGLATGLPLIVYSDSTWILQIERGAGSVRPSRERCLALFGWSAFGGILATLIAIMTGDVLAVPSVPHTLLGFYKKASGIGLWLSTLPILVTLAYAVSIGEDRPLWIQELDACLSRLLDSEDLGRRPQLTRQVLALLFTNRRAITREQKHLAFVAHQFKRLLFMLSPLDTEQLASELAQDPETMRAELERIAAELDARNTQKRGAVVTPLLLVKDGETLCAGELSVACHSDPGRRVGTALDIYRNGYLIQPNAMLRDSVALTIRTVEVEIIGPRGDGRLPFEGDRLEVHFRHAENEAAEFRGRSYELPLALATWLLAIESTPRCPRWCATGTLDVLRLFIGEVEGLALKIAAAESPGSVLFASSAAVEKLTLPDGEKRLVRALRDDGLQEAGQLAADLYEHLGSGGSAIIGVRTLRQAIRIIAGRNP